MLHPQPPMLALLACTAISGEFLKRNTVACVPTSSRVLQVSLDGQET